MESIVQALILWIAANSQYSVENVMQPNVVFMTPQEITAEYYQDYPKYIPANKIDDRIWALYNAESSENGTIYLRIDNPTLNQHLRLARQSRAIDLRMDEKGIDREADESSDGYKSLFEDNPILTERLLHELVHHVQFQTGVNKSFQCIAYGEKEAYRLGGLFFKQRYIEDPMPNRNFWAHVYSRC